MPFSDEQWPTPDALGNLLRNANSLCRLTLPLKRSGQHEAGSLP